METITFYEFFPNKEDEQRHGSENRRTGPSHQLVRIRRKSAPVLYDLLGSLVSLPVFHIEKILTKSDTNHLCRLVLPQKEVQKHIFRFWDSQMVRMIAEGRAQRRVVINDIDTGCSEHQLVFRRWHYNNTYVIQSNWRKEFVKRRGLRSGDKIGLSWIPEMSRFYFSVLNRG